MNTYSNYLKEIEKKSSGLHPKPIDDSSFYQKL